jgi:hypothetical protein
MGQFGRFLIATDRPTTLARGAIRNLFLVNIPGPMQSSRRGATELDGAEADHRYPSTWRNPDTPSVDDDGGGAEQSALHRIVVASASELAGLPGALNNRPRSSRWSTSMGG